MKLPAKSPLYNKFSRSMRFSFPITFTLTCGIALYGVVVGLHKEHVTLQNGTVILVEDIQITQIVEVKCA